jgi:hypothetical protein
VPTLLLLEVVVVVVVEVEVEVVLIVVFGANIFAFLKQFITLVLDLHTASSACQGREGGASGKT